ncbi:MAG: hypothetical protein H7Y37_00600 [Anaerolineae bacterium]|nr:hypothetical protein [Gloeobacterales cyanobacterium ES-bin-313]
MPSLKTFFPFCSVLVLLGALPTTPVVARPAIETSLSFKEILKLQKTSPFSPIVRIVSPVPQSLVTPGEGVVGVGSLNGTGFAINVEIVTRDQVPLRVEESTDIRDTSQLGKANPSFPGLYVFFDTDLIKPDGGVIPKDTNLAALFNVAGTDDTPGEGVTVWTGWHVLESLPPNLNKFTITAAVVDEAGRIGLDRVIYKVDRDGAASGQALTPVPAEFAGGDGQADTDGPELTMIAPRVPTAVATGPAGTPVSPDGSLFFIQVTAVDRAKAGIGVTEGVILDASQVPNPTGNPTGGPNRFYPGLSLTFDVPLRQPNGNLIAAGANLAPLFNIAGSELTDEGLVRTTADWVVGGSLELPSGKTTVKVSASVTDNAGHTSTLHQIVGISPVINGQDLTATP